MSTKLLVECRGCGQKGSGFFSFPSLVPGVMYFLCKKCFSRVQFHVIKIVDITRTPFIEITDFLPNNGVEKWIDRLEKEKALVL